MPEPRRSPKPIQTPTPVGQLQTTLDVLQRRVSQDLTRGQRARGGLPRPKAVGKLATGGLGVSNITPVGGATEGIAKALRVLRLIPQRSTLISRKAVTHKAGVPGVFRHETAHQLLRSQGIPQRGENVIKKIQLPQDVPMRDFFRVTEQVGRTEKTPTKEQRRRVSKMRQRVLIGRERRKRGASAYRSRTR